jgi:hypothetical protein
MRKHPTIAFLVALANMPVAYAQDGLANKNNPFEYPVTISRCQPAAIDNKYDPNPAVRVDIAIDSRSFSVAHHMANGTRTERFARTAHRGGCVLHRLASRRFSSWKLALGVMG